ncbi:YbaK/EbsC family protein [Thermobifida cellulosilytica]|uniref:Prolyl-tRNA synthetase n=1 Tax=Thermobifida cellulosilytica TB100 TaxID=665004 RepID=A0A147KEI0_THECS|nr:YbaK/EbsC family protein [Thermobifida cellulosilytica]KUP95704.1 prolyl-tRNA synthetase [Thermobifida cellulosilytica TB100]
MHPNTRRVADLLAARGAGGTVRELPDSARTAAAAAAQLGCDVGAIANSLVFAARGGDFSPSDGLRPVLVLTSGAHRVDTTKVAVLLGAAEVVRATPEFVREHTGQPIGGVAPLGHPAPIPTLVDEWLDRHEVVWAAAGHPHTVFPTSFAELCRLTGGTPADVGRDAP